MREVCPALCCCISWGTLLFLKKKTKKRIVVWQWNKLAFAFVNITYMQNIISIPNFQSNNRYGNLISSKVIVYQSFTVVLTIWCHVKRLWARELLCFGVFQQKKSTCFRRWPVMLGLRLGLQSPGWTPWVRSTFCSWSQRLHPWVSAWAHRSRVNT